MHRCSVAGCHTALRAAKDTVLKVYISLQTWYPT